MVDMLTSVSGVGNTEAEIEVEAFEKSIAEVVTLNHSKSVHGLAADDKLHCRANILEPQKGGFEVVANKSGSEALGAP